MVNVGFYPLVLVKINKLNPVLQNLEVPFYLLKTENQLFCG